MPRVYEKIHEAMLEIGRQNTGVKKMIGDWAKHQAYQHHQNKMNGQEKFSLQYQLARKLILSQVQMTSLTQLL